MLSSVIWERVMRKPTKKLEKMNKRAGLHQGFNKIGGDVFMKFPFIVTEIPKTNKCLRWKNDETNEDMVQTICTSSGYE